MGGELSGLCKGLPATVYLMEWLFYLYRLLSCNHPIPVDAWFASGIKIHVALYFPHHLLLF
jgi:hypothetical protein